MILHGETMGAVPLRWSTSQGCPPLSFLFSIVLEVFNSGEGRKRKHSNGREIGKRMEEK